MPKTRRRKKAKAKSKSKNKAKKKAPGTGAKQREVILAVVERLGATQAEWKNNFRYVIVTHPNYPPFVIDFTKREILGVLPDGSEAAVVALENQPPLDTTKKEDAA